MMDDFIFFDNKKKFYPNPGNQFFESTLRISVPKPFNVIASGFLKSKKIFNNRNEKIFKTKGTKGLTIVCGKFHLKDELKTKIPLKIFAYDDVKVKQYFDKNEIISIFDYLYKIYGRRGIKSVNLLLRRWSRYGGVSYRGFVVLDIIKRQFLKLEISKKINLINSPVVLTANIRRDNLVHELAHQWWGGVISWKTYQDVWLTEGGAQFSALLYLEKILSKKKFNKIIKKVIKKVRLASKFGPIIYGKRIMNITEKMSTYQSLIYNKAALVFFMFRNMVGKDMLFKKIDNIFSNFTTKSMSTSKFINEMIRDESDEKKMYLERFFKKWIYSRNTPVVYYSVNLDKNKASIVFEQQNTNFVFPLKIIIKTKDGQELKKIIIRNKKQDVKIISESIIKDIKVDKCFSPIYLKKKRKKR
jgi:aminopeptidase N